MKTLLTWMTCFCFFMSPCAYGAIDEIFELYNSPGGLAMGNALTADASGYIANYYNPAGLAKASRKNWEIHVLAFDFISGLASLSNAIAIQSWATSALANKLQTLPGSYYYHRMNFSPAISSRGFATSFLGSFTFAGVSDGTNLDVRATTDLAPTMGFATNLAGNILKFGTSVSLLLRNELFGVFDHANITTEQAVRANSKEGVGLAVNMGMMVTFPTGLLPTMGVVVKDLGNTTFVNTRLLAGINTGAPDRIPQSYNAAFSLHPRLGKTLKSTVALEFRHLERSDINILNRTSLGFQLEDEKTFYFWLGWADMTWTMGMAYRVPGGNIELSTYGAKVNNLGTTQEDRRFMLRYTLGF